MNNSTTNTSKIFSLKKAGIAGIISLTVFLAGCSGGNPAPQDQSSTDATAADNSGAMTQQDTQQMITSTQPPSEGWTIHMTAKKLLPGNQDMPVDKYCKSVVGSMTQCQLFDSNDNDARLIGVETMVGPEMYNTFTSDEKKLWMPTKDFMAATSTAMPDLDQEQFTNVAQSLANNYSKVYLLWDPGKIDLPTGSPTVTVMGGTASTGTTVTTGAGAPTTTTAGQTSPAPASAQPVSSSSGFTAGTFDISKLASAGLQQNKSNFGSSVLQTGTMGSLQLVALKSSIASHTYANTTQLIYIVSGSGKFTINGKSETVSSGMLVIIPNGSSQAFQNLGGKDTPLIYVTLKTPFDDTDVKWN